MRTLCLVLLLALLGPACGGDEVDDSPTPTPTAPSPSPSDPCPSHLAADDGSGRACGQGGASSCPAVDCPCEDGSTVSSQACLNGTCLGRATCAEACAQAGGYRCQEMTTGPTPTCSDGTQNGNEQGVDCGGDCPACAAAPTCSDGIQNGDEQDVDCGGSCAPCAAAPTCSDGRRNGNEQGVDCGGDCPACAAAPTCSDGIQNGNERGVDCGGSCTPCPSANDCPFAASISALSNAQAVDRLAPTGRRLVIVRGEVAATQGSGQLDILLANTTDVFVPGRYAIESGARIPGLCESDDCITLTFSNGGKNYRTAAIGGTVELLEDSPNRLRLTIEGTTFSLNNPGLTEPEFRPLRDCTSPVALDLSLDLPYTPL